MKTIKGIINFNSAGTGFVKKNNIEIRIQKCNINYAIVDDLVIVSNITKYNNKYEGIVIKIIKRKITKILGIVVSKLNSVYTIFIPILNNKISCDLGTNLNLNDVIHLKIIGKNININKNKFRVIKKIGNFANSEIDNIIVKKIYKISSEFPKNVLKSIKKLKEPDNLKNRIDLTKLNCITIDPDTSKDFDDAISLKIKNNKQILGVHIADVSYYVTENSPIDIEARKRTNSTYLLDETIPMLPFKLADDLCSLVPNKNRYAISIFMTISNGKVVDSIIKRTMIQNKKRFTYTEAKKILDSKNVANNKWYSLLNNFKKLCLEIKEYKTKNGHIEFNQNNHKYKLNSKKELVDIELEENDITHQMIETFMVLANENIAKYLSKKYKHVPYRVQKPSESNKIFVFNNFINDLYNKRPKDLNKFFKQIKGTRLESLVIVKYIMIVANKAEYTTTNIGHAFLNLKYYTHFTSPIRRYIDLIIHRLITGTFNLSKDKLDVILLKCNENERNSAAAEKSEEAFKLHRYFEKNKKQYAGIIKSITQNNIYIHITKFDYEAVIDLKSFCNIQLTKFNRCIILNNKKYCLGEIVKIFPEKINIIEKKIEWKLNL